MRFQVAFATHFLVQISRRERVHRANPAGGVALSLILDDLSLRTRTGFTTRIHARLWLRLHRNKFASRLSHRCENTSSPFCIKALRTAVVTAWNSPSACPIATASDLVGQFPIRFSRRHIAFETAVVDNLIAAAAIAERIPISSIVDTVLQHILVLHCSSIQGPGVRY